MSTRVSPASSGLLASMLEELPDPVFVKDEQHRWVVLNDAFCRFMGRPREELLGRSDYDFFPKEEADVFWEKDALVFRTGTTNENEESFTDRQGKRHTILTKKALVTADGQRFLVGTIRDISERREMEAELRRRDRLATWGLLAASVGHEINNPLSFIIANLEYCQERLEELIREAPRAALELRDVTVESLEGARRIAAIVKDLGLFARPPTGEQSAGVRENAQMAARLVSATFPGNGVLVEVDSGLRVRCAQSRLGQVLVNLLMNAHQAFEETPDRPRSIELRAEAAGADWVHISVRDNGAGMSPQVLARAFDPFFTTRRAGSGLGLALCHSIVTAAGGTLRVDSQRGEGTTVHVKLPRATVAAAAVEKAPSALRRGVRLLVVDDDALVAASVRRLLQGHCDVTLAASAQEALERVREGAAVDVVLSDLSMPGMSGLELYDVLSREFPALGRRMGFFTGGVRDLEGQARQQGLGVRCIEKPFTQASLLALIDLLAPGGGAEERSAQVRPPSPGRGLEPPGESSDHGSNDG